MWFNGPNQLKPELNQVELVQVGLVQLSSVRSEFIWFRFRFGRNTPRTELN